MNYCIIFDTSNYKPTFGPSCQLVLIETQIFIMRIDSCDYRGWDMPQYAAWKLGTRKACGNSVHVWRPENQGSQWCKSQSLKAGEPRVLMFVPAQGENSPSIHLFVAFKPSTVCMHVAPSHWWGMVFFIESIDSNVISSGNTLTYTSRNNILWAMWASAMTAVAQWIGHRPTSQSVTGSIPS